MMINEKDNSLMLLIDRGMMELIEYSADAILGAARQRRQIWDASGIKDSTEGSTSSCSVFKKYNEACYVNDNSDLDERENYMMLPEVVNAETKEMLSKEFSSQKSSKQEKWEQERNQFHD